MKTLKHISFVLLAIISIALISCNKEIPEDTGNSNFNTYDAYSPEGHDMNDNGLFFMDRTRDIASNEYLSVFGFDPEGKFMFNERNALDVYLENATDYNNIRIKEMMLEDKLLIIGDAQQNDSTYVFVSVIDQMNGLIVSKHVVKVSDEPADFGYDTKLVKTSYGYMVFVVGQYGLFNRVKMTKTDEDFNIIENGDIILGTGTVVLNDATVTGNDELILAYFRADGPSTPFFVRSVNSDFSPNWLQTFNSSYSATDSLANSNRKVMMFNNNIVLFSLTDFSGTVAGATMSSSSPTFYTIDPISGTATSQHIIEGSFPNKGGGTSIFGTTNLETVRVINDTEIIVSGYVTSQNIYSGAMIHYNSSFGIENNFFINDSRPISRFHFVGLNSEGDYIGAGYTPRFGPASFVDPGISGDVLSIFVGNYDSAGNINVE